MVVDRAQNVTTPRITDEANLLDWVCRYIEGQGFTYPREVVADYYISLKTKPFVILTGVSGTGKTRLTQLLADALTSAGSGHYLLVPVAPDWTDNSYLMGYYNVIQERQIDTAFSRFYNMAGDVRKEPFFVCLDEMNLAKVEHYFSHFLSNMETGDFPANLFITGTVNIDESTYQFSRKVLDRANTIEFNDVNLLDRPRGGDVYDSFTVGERQAMFDLFLVSREMEWDEDVLFTLDGINAILKKRNLQFAYRVRNEVLKFVGNAEGLLEKYTALDLQILQKVLPKLSGTREQLERVLVEMLSYLLLGNNDPLPAPVKDLYLLDPAEYEECLFPRSAKKIARMLARVREDGFVTFYE